MVFNKAKEELKWKMWKEQEEQILRELGFPESKILELRKYDWKDFNADRRFKTRQYTNYNFLENVGVVNTELPINDFSDLLDQLENEELYQMMLYAHLQTKVILFLKIEGYTNKEISKLTGLNEVIISRRLKDIRKKLKKIL